MKMLLAALLLVGASAVAGAQTTGTATAEGEVRRIDRDGGKVTVRHGPIAAWDMPSMTMVFRPREPAMLETMKVGDRIEMTLSSGGGAMVIESFRRLQ